MLKSITRIGGIVLAGALTLVLPWLIGEGVYSLLHRTSFGYELYLRWFSDQVAQDPSVQMITDVGEISALVDQLRSNAIGLGNSPFRELKTDDAAVNATENGCLIQKPNLHKTMAFLRSNLFNPFDQLTYFHDTDRPLPPDVARFFSAYEVRQVHLTTNAAGERLTLPHVDAVGKALVAGDSIANGMMLDDTETIASRLQARDSSQQYVNLGIAGATAADVVCELQRAAARYHGHIRSLLYVFCENDFDPSAPYGTPDPLIAWLQEFHTREHIEHVTFLYVPYVYNSVPEVTRIVGHTHRNFPTFHDEKRRLLSLARAAGFAVVDYLDVTNAQRHAAGSQFAPLALYVDHSHLSNLGIDLLLPRLLDAH